MAKTQFVLLSWTKIRSPAIKLTSWNSKGSSRKEENNFSKDSSYFSDEDKRDKDAELQHEYVTKVNKNRMIKSIRMIVSRVLKVAQHEKENSKDLDPVAADGDVQLSGIFALAIRRVGKATN